MFSNTVLLASYFPSKLAVCDRSCDQESPFWYVSTYGVGESGGSSFLSFVTESFKCGIFAPCIVCRRVIYCVFLYTQFIL